MNQISVKYSYALKTEGDTIKPLFKTKTYTTKGYKFYENIMYKIAKLDRCSTLLFHFLCEEMDESNTIHSTAAVRSEFIRKFIQIAGLKFKDETVKKALSKLIKAELIIKYGKRIDYTVNPQHVFKGSETARKSLIQKIIYDQRNKNNYKSNYKSALGLSD
jgi:hypothetical protein